MKTINMLITESYKELEIDNKEKSIDLNTPIFGGESQLDSLSLVTFLISLEQKIEDHFERNITIADEKALSLKNSPFKTVGTLNDYLQKRLEIKSE